MDDPVPAPESPRRGESAGTQNERTSLAWSRTALSVVVTAAIVSRLAVESIGPIALVSVAAAVPVSIALVLGSRRRYRRRMDWTERAPLRIRDGRFEFAVAAVTVLMILVLAAAVVS
ncbi:DUF202 domain-containing protein [Solicola gregarius]|uniref:DUF202 domain-containing protein n=1 Tax=Solicola gregarius TaxID=2908642 RepID=A0AA46TMQ8_9ACTN|nr:DUF202 domain-containing protein [Solicola gregarius]UYM07787.1 DUF202 domain-containing protein [Solicola gregarius]